MSCKITEEQIQGLIGVFAKCMYAARETEQGSMDYEIIDQCTALLKSDYSVIEIGNRTGELSSHYPGVIIIPEYETNVGAAFPLSLAGLSGGGIISHQTQQQRPQQVIYENTHDPNKLRDLINKSRAARCRTRFPAPVILYKGKYVCRSSTLSGAPEMYGRYYLSSAESSEMLRDDSDCDNEPSEVKDLIDDNTLKEKAKLKPTVSDWQLFDRMRHQDIKLLKTLNVGIIVDFMVEKKKVKFGVNVTSSEKVDKEKRYSDFTILSLPYPGCEFFRDYRDNNYSGSGIVFDWSQAYVDADLGVPDDALKSQLNINWDNYKTWDLVTITKNYLKLILKYLQDKSSGLLLHCISGWDRTPLFVSLLRLSLWADGVIHQSLDANQILYLTISYDWYLFGHNLPDRLSKGEDIFFFCFYALKFIEKDEFSILSPRQKSKNSSGSSSISVLRTESECAMDDLIMMCGSDSRGSNISLNSISSCVSSKSHSDQNHVLLETSLDCTNRTSPVSVPIASRPTRQRNDSSSSLSVGSWQMISGTGSLRSVNDSLSLGNMFGNHNRSSHSNQMSQESSSCTLADDENASQSSTDGTTIREERLHAVRQLFYHSYCTSIGFRFNNGSDSRLGNLLGNFAEKVGLSQK